MHQPCFSWTRLTRNLYAIVFTATLGLGCGDAPTPKKELRPVRFQEIFSTGSGRVRTFSGVCKAGIESKLSFRVPGTLEKLNVQVGDKVKKGQILAELDATDYALKVQEAQASLQNAKAIEIQAKNDYERVLALYENNNASASDLDASRAKFKSAQAGVSATQKVIQLAQLQVSYTRLRAPEDGDIAEVPVEVNENTQAGKTVVVLTSGSVPEVQLAVPEVLISKVKQGSRVDIRLDAEPGKQFKGTVSEIGVMSLSTATTFRVTVKFDSAFSEVRPGMAAEVSIKFEYRKDEDRILVPPASVGEDREGRHVFVVIPGDSAGIGIVHKRRVTIGDLTDDGLEVIEGLIDGDLLVTAGVSRIQDGMPVKMSAGR